MLLYGRNCLLECLLLVVSLTVNVVNAAGPHMNVEYDNYDDTLKQSNEAIKFKEIQNKFLDIVGNSTSKVHSLTQLMGLIQTDTGKEMGRLLVEGVMLGIQQKDASHALGEFLEELQGRLSPALQHKIQDYRDFFKGIDIRTIPLMWEQIFRKDELGNSLAGMPLGQIVDLIQPTASKYGIDIRAFMDSMMGKGDNNVRDLILSLFENADFSSIWSQLLNVTTNAVLPMTDSFKNSGSQAVGRDNRKQDKTDKTLRLFRPLVSSLLRENQVDLDADAVLQVLSPLFKNEFFNKFSPLLSMLSAQGDGGGFGPLVANLLGGGEGPKANPVAGLVGALGGLMAASGGKNQMDMGTIINLAAAFMDQPSKKKKNSKSMTNKKTKTRENDGLDLSSLMNMAGNLMGNMDMNTILDIAAASIKNEDRKVRQTDSSTKLKNTKQGPRAPAVPKKEVKESKPKKETTSKYKKTPKHLIDIIEPILKSMKTDKKCNAKIRDAIDLGKSMLNNKMSSIGGFKQIIPLLVSLVSNEEFFKSQSVNMEKLTTSFTQALTYADWNEFLISLESQDFRETLVQNILPNAAELVTLIASEESQQKIYDVIVPRLQMLMGNYGLSGVTLDNFPERLAPVLGLLSRSWNLPFNPTTILVPLKVYLKGLKTWTLAGLQEIRTLTPKEVQKLVKEKLENDISDGILSVMRVSRLTSNPNCLPQMLCQVNSGLQSDSLKATVTRFVSLVSAAGPVLQTPDSNLLLQTVEAISETYEDCQISFPGDCSLNDELENEEETDEEEQRHEETEEEDNYEDPLAMELMYDHVEL